ncbi:cytochrome b [Zobellella sp. An-6]|uniref:cytochrome b n=1 Tax=Zobellella sp. An-6 TaxID=3400218 RepID=UPI00404123B6
MQWGNNAQRYGVTSRFLHLGMALLIFLIIGLGWYAGSLPRGPARGDAFFWHKSLGVLLLLPLLGRLLWHRVSRVPAGVLRGGQAKLARAGHHLLYLLMLVMPLSGILMSVAAGREVAVFDWWVIGGWVSPLDQLASLANATHRLAANLLVVVLLLHMLAALYHRLVLQDGVWERMFGRTSRTDGR